MREISDEAKNSVLVLLAELVSIKDCKNVHLLEARKRIISRIEADLFGNGTIYAAESIEKTGNRLLDNANNK
jgi:hypothetical protein